jgi:small subunit ribosomal protein S4
MARNLKPKHAMCRRCGEKLCGLDKCPVQRRSYPKGVHGPTSRRRLTGYGIQLLEKQKAKVIYGILERQFRLYVKEATRSHANTSDLLLQLLERRLDNVVYRLGFAKSRSQSRQMVAHGHFTLNGRKVTIPSIQVRVGDMIGIREHSAGKKLFENAKENLAKIELPVWLAFDPETMTAKIISLPVGSEIRPLFDPKAIVEFYSR